MILVIVYRILAKGAHQNLLNITLQQCESLKAETTNIETFKLLFASQCSNLRCKITWKMQKNFSCIFNCPSRVMLQTRICTTWASFLFTFCLLFIISTPKLEVWRNFLSIRIVFSCFYLLIFYFEKFSTESEVCRWPYTCSLNSLIRNDPGKTGSKFFW